MPSRRRTLATLLIVSFGHVLLISAQVRSSSGLPVIEAVGFGAFAGISQAAGAVADGGRSMWNRYVALGGVERENAELLTTVAELEGRIQLLEAQQRGVRALEDALGLRAALDLETLAARVIAGSPTPGALTVTIDRGTADGVAQDMAVISGAGVVGRVIGPVTARAAQVQLLVGRNAGAGAILANSGAGGVISGGAGGVGEPPMSLDMVPNLVVVEPGERVLTSGQDGIFPAGLEIGTVESAVQGAQFQRIAVTPAVEFSHLDIVLVVLVRPDEADGAS